MKKISSLDILIDMPLLREQYNFLVQKYQIDVDEIEYHGFTMNQYDQEMWDGILNLFESVLEYRLTNDEVTDRV